MNAWKTWDRIFNRISWTVLGVYIAYELGVRFALPADAVAGIDREMRVRGKRYIATYLRENVPTLIDRAFASDMLREKLEKGVLPKVGVKAAQLIGENKQAILDKLRLEQRVTEAVDGMSVATFHRTLDEFMSENLCAVQVLGFVLGAAVGALQLLSRIRT